MSTQDEDARSLAGQLRAMTNDQMGRLARSGRRFVPASHVWRRDEGQYAFDVKLSSGRDARVVVMVEAISSRPARQP